MDLLLHELVVPLFYQGFCSSSRFGLCLFAGFGHPFRVVAGGGLTDGVDALDALYTIRLSHALAEPSDVFQAIGAEWTLRHVGDDLHRREGGVVEVLLEDVVPRAGFVLVGQDARLGDADLHVGYRVE